MDKFKELTTELAEKISLETLNFIESELNEYENTSDVMNLITSSHLDSLFSLLNAATIKKPLINEKVRKFCSELSQYLDTYFEKQ